MSWNYPEDGRSLEIKGTVIFFRGQEERTKMKGIYIKPVNREQFKRYRSLTKDIKVRHLNHDLL